MFIDTHAHIYDEYYENIYEILNSSVSMGVKCIISAGIDYKTNKELLEKIKKYANFYITLGIHPECAGEYNENDLIHIETNLNNSRVIAIGEIGLDYHYDGFNKEIQIKLFHKQLQLAQKYNMPVVVHSREATQDTIDILKQYDLKGIIHSFSGSKEVAKEYIKMGYKLGINGVVTFKNAHIKEIVKELGLEYFVLETDSPYLTPVPYRGKQNYPGNITIIAQFLSDYLGISKEEISKITNENVVAVFDKLSL